MNNENIHTYAHSDSGNQPDNIPARVAGVWRKWPQSERGKRALRLRIFVPAVQLLVLKDADGRRVIELKNIIRLVDGSEGVFVIGRNDMRQKRAANFDNRLAITQHMI